MKKHIFLFAALFAFALSSCSYFGFVSVDPSGQYIAKKIQTTSFENVSVSSGFELILTQDSLTELTIETYENIHSYIVVEVVGNTLEIHPEEGISFAGDPKVKIHLSCNFLDELSSSGGGRYDHMLSDFGTDCPATGFALGIERIMLALERQGLPRPKSQKDIYLSYALGKEIQAVQEAGRLRGQGMVVELSLQPQTEAEANEEQNGKEYDKLVYIS